MADIYIIHTVCGNMVEIDREEARKIYETIQREYRIEDIKQSIEDMEYSKELSADKLTDDVLNEICNDYEDRLSEDDSWVYTLDDTVYDYFYRKGTTT